MRSGSHDFNNANTKTFGNQKFLFSFLFFFISNGFSNANEFIRLDTFGVQQLSPKFLVLCGIQVLLASKLFLFYFLHLFDLIYHPMCTNPM